MIYFKKTIYSLIHSFLIKLIKENSNEKIFYVKGNNQTFISCIIYFWCELEAAIMYASQENAFQKQIAIENKAFSAINLLYMHSFCEYKETQGR